MKTAECCTYSNRSRTDHLLLCESQSGDFLCSYVCICICISLVHVYVFVWYSYSSIAGHLSLCESQYGFNCHPAATDFARTKP